MTITINNLSYQFNADNTVNYVQAQFGGNENNEYINAQVKVTADDLAGKAFADLTTAQIQTIAQAKFKKYVDDATTTTTTA